MQELSRLRRRRWLLVFTSALAAFDRWRRSQRT